MSTNTFFIKQNSVENCVVELKHRFAHLKQYDQKALENGQDQCIKDLQNLIDKHIATQS